MLIWSFILAGVGLTGLWLQGSGRWYGWAFTIVGQTAWIAYSLLFGQWGFLLGTAGYLFVATRNLRRWLRIDRDGLSTPGMATDPVCACPCACGTRAAAAA